MVKQGLMEYLAAVCDAENAIYSCNEVISALEWEKRNIPHACAPRAPERTVRAPESKRNHYGITFHECLGAILGLIAGGIFLYLSAYLLVSIKLSGYPNIIAFVVVVVATCMIARVTFKQSVKKLGAARKGRLNRKMESRADVEYQGEMKKYDNEYAAYLKAKEVEECAAQIVDQSIAKQRENIARLSQQLERLYQRNIIYDSFRNIIAVNAIREYLAMGICDTLDGPNGAYAQYMQDVRVNRICTSIDEMKRQLVNSLRGIASTQDALLREMKTTNGHVHQMKENLNTGFQQLQGGMSEYQRTVSEGLSSASAQLASINNTLAGVRSASQASAHNQYIAAREANIQGYLLRTP